MCITRERTKHHLSHILDKLGLSRRSQVAAYAAQRGLLEPPQSGQRPG